MKKIKKLISKEASPEYTRKTFCVDKKILKAFELKVKKSKHKKKYVVDMLMTLYVES